VLTLLLGFSSLLTPANAVYVSERRFTAGGVEQRYVPWDIELVGQIGGPVFAVAVQGNYAYVGVGPRLIVLDVSDPAHLRMIGRTVKLLYAIHDIAVVGGYAYVAVGESGTWLGGLWIIDVANPAAPTIVSGYRRG